MFSLMCVRYKSCFSMFVTIYFVLFWVVGLVVTQIKVHILTCGYIEGPRLFPSLFSSVKFRIKSAIKSFN